MDVFENVIDFLLVPEVAQEATDVLVLQVRLDFDLTPQGPCHAVFCQLSLVHDLQSDEELAFLFTGEVHVTELATGQRSPDLEVSRTPGVRVEASAELIDCIEVVGGADARRRDGQPRRDAGSLSACPGNELLHPFGGQLASGLALRAILAPRLTLS